ncbi:hypothetical protein PUN28_019459 [Cardiocondyla obscurior]
MNNSAAKSESSILPPIQSAKRPNSDEKVDLAKTLPGMIGELSINKSAKQSVNKLNSAARRKIAECNSKLRVSSYNVDEMSFEELQAALSRSVENPQQPFSFLANISNEFTSNKPYVTKSTDIDMQLTAVAERIKSIQVLLEKAKSQIEYTYLCAKQKDIH